MPTLLVTGASRGIGLEIARQYVAAGWRVHATCRKPRTIEGAVVHALDVTDFAGVEVLARELRGESIDLLINNAGILGPGGDGLDEVERDGWIATLMTNAVAPLKLAAAFLPHVAKSERKLICSITSGMGSIGDNGGGGWYAYRTSKAALNMAMKNLSLEVRGRGVTVVVMNPGWVKTDMGGRGANITPERSVTGMRKVLGGVTLEDTGKFLSWDGGGYPW
jgi:NAD(P)-dependent dehydrogenase (short-subunit alcohol dehydrogenase family)